MDTQNKLEPLSQSGPSLVPCHGQRLGCGLLSLKKSCHTLSAVATAKVICLVPAHALVSCPCHLVTFLYLFILTSTLLLSCPFNSLCFYLLFCFILRSLSSRNYCCSPSSVSKSPSLSALGLDYQRHLSFCPSLDGFEVLL